MDRSIVLVPIVTAIIAAIPAYLLLIQPAIEDKRSPTPESIPTPTSESTSTSPETTTTAPPEIDKQGLPYVFVRAWGSEGSSNGQFNTPTGIAVDSSDEIYVAENINDRIQKFTSDGTFITAWGSKGSSIGQFSGPLDIAVGSSGVVYVADGGNNQRIQVFAPKV